METFDPCLPARATSIALNRLYIQYNRRELIHPDPLEFVHRYDDPGDRELVGIVASSLAYGRVAQIHTSVSSVLCRMTPSPRRFLSGASQKSLQSAFRYFKHRFTTGEEFVRLLLGVKAIIERCGSLQSCFVSALGDGDATVLPALTVFAEELAGNLENSAMLIPSPKNGSACKRLNLFLRWMVRKDGVDPGGWDRVSPSQLIVPLDVHMHRIGIRLGLTGRKQPDMRTALEITEGFRKIDPGDPVRYDFALTRLGMRGAR